MKLIIESNGLDLKKVSAGHYKTADGKYEVEKSDGFWYAVDSKTGQSVVDCENSFSQIKDSLESYIKSKSKKESFGRKRFTEGKRIISKDEYDYWFNVGVEAFERGDKCVPAHSPEIREYMKENPSMINSNDAQYKKTDKVVKAWIDGWTKANRSAPVESIKASSRKRSIRESVSVSDAKWFTDIMDEYTDHLNWYMRDWGDWTAEGYDVPEKDRSSGEIRNVSYGLVFSGDVFGKKEDLILVEYLFTGNDRDITIKLTCAKLGIMGEKLPSCNPDDLFGDFYSNVLNSNIASAFDINVRSCMDQLEELANGKNESVSRRSIKEGDASKKTNYAVMVRNMNNGKYNLYTGTKAKCEELLDVLESLESFADECEDEDEYCWEEAYAVDLMDDYGCIEEIYYRMIDENDNYNLANHYGDYGQIVHIINADAPVDLYL
jgi:hypothetical protein